MALSRADTLSTNSLCGTPGPTMEGAGRVRLLVGPALPVPTTLGTFALGEISQGVEVVPPDSGNGSCGTTAEIASRAPTLTLSGEAEAWRAFLLVEFLVDGAPRGAVRTGAGVPIPYRSQFDGPDVLPYVVCDIPAIARFGISPGRHRFQYRAVIPGMTQELLSNEIEAEISCGALRGDGGVATDGSVARDGSVATDSSVATDGSVATDAPAPRVDAGVQDAVAVPAMPDASTDAGPTIMPQGGGGCSVAGPARGGAGVWLAALVLGVYRSRRRRSEPRCRRARE